MGDRNIKVGETHKLLDRVRKVKDRSLKVADRPRKVRDRTLKVEETHKYCLLPDTLSGATRQINILGI